MEEISGFEKQSCRSDYYRSLFEVYLRICDYSLGSKGARTVHFSPSRKGLHGSGVTTCCTLIAWQGLAQQQTIEPKRWPGDHKNCCMRPLGCLCGSAAPRSTRPARLRKLSSTSRLPRAASPCTTFEASSVRDHVPAHPNYPPQSRNLKCHQMPPNRNRTTDLLRWCWERYWAAARAPTNVLISTRWFCFV